MQDGNIYSMSATEPLKATTLMRFVDKNSENIR